MANSRLEKIGTIYTRTRGLIQSGALNWSDRPVWYDIYDAFPPKEEPCFARPAAQNKLKEIFYEEDKIRALLHKNVKFLGTVNLLSRQSKSFTQRFIITYQNLEKRYDTDASQEKLFNETLEILKTERNTLKAESESTELNDIEKTSSHKHISAPVSIKDIFKE